jgi:hypothetical protein
MKASQDAACRAVVFYHHVSKRRVAKSEDLANYFAQSQISTHLRYVPKHYRSQPLVEIPIWIVSVCCAVCVAYGMVFSNPKVT